MARKNSIPKIGKFKLNWLGGYVEKEEFNWKRPFMTGRILEKCPFFWTMYSFVNTFGNTLEEVLASPILTNALFIVALDPPLPKKNNYLRIPKCVLIQDRPGTQNAANTIGTDNVTLLQDAGIFAGIHSNHLSHDIELPIPTDNLIVLTKPDTSNIAFAFHDTDYNGMEGGDILLIWNTSSIYVKQSYTYSNASESDGLTLYGIAWQVPSVVTVWTEGIEKDIAQALLLLKKCNRVKWIIELPYSYTGTITFGIAPDGATMFNPDGSIKNIYLYGGVASSQHVDLITTNLAAINAANLATTDLLQAGRKDALDLAIIGGLNIEYYEVKVTLPPAAGGGLYGSGYANHDAAIPFVAEQIRDFYDLHLPS